MFFLRDNKNIVIYTKIIIEKEMMNFVFIFFIIEF